VDGSGYTHTCGPLFLVGVEPFQPLFRAKHVERMGEREKERKLVGAFALKLPQIFFFFPEEK